MIPLSSRSSPVYHPIKGLSSPFRDRPLASMTSRSHVIDISPSPPPHLVRTTVSGRFDDLHSPQGISPDRVSVGLGISHDRKTSVKLFAHGKMSRQPVGLGLGIHTGEDNLGGFMNTGQSAEVQTTGPVATKNVFSWFPNSLSNRQSKASPLRFGFASRHDAQEWAESSYEEESETTNQYIGSNFDRKENHRSQTFLEESENLIDTITFRQDGKALPIGLRKRLGSPRAVSLASAEGPLGQVSQQSPATQEHVETVAFKLLSFDKSGSEPPPLFPREADKIPTKVLKPILRKPSARLLRYRLNPHTKDELDQNFSPPPSGSGEAGSDSPLISAAPKPSHLPHVPSPADVKGLSMPMTEREAPLLHASSPSLPVHSPTFSPASASLSPLIYHNLAFSPSISNTSHAEEMPQQPGGSTLMLSILAGGLGSLGLFFIVAVVFCKKSHGSFRMPFSKRKTRGTAYDEFMEETNWWIAEKKLSLHRERKPSTKGLGNEIYSEPQSRFSDDEDDTSGPKISRFLSRAPSIPPLAHIINCKISLDSLHADLSAVSSPMDSTVYNMTGNYEDNLRFLEQELDFKDSQSMHEAASAPSLLAQGETKSASALVTRARSGSKSSILSKASLKSIGSLASLFLSVTHFDSLGGVGKKTKVERDVGDEDHKHSSVNMDADPFCKSSPQRVEKASLGLCQYQLKRVEESMTRRASVHLDKFDCSPEPAQVPKRPKTMSFIPPAILITDHPSELIPPSPPQLAPFGKTTVSAAACLGDYSNWDHEASDKYGMHDNTFFSPKVTAATLTSSHLQRICGQSSTSQCSPTNVEDPSDANLKLELEGFCREKQGTVTNQVALPSGKFHAKESPQITSLSSLLSYRAQLNKNLTAHRIQPSTRSNSSCSTAGKSGMGTITCAQTIQDLNAVTEDLRALINSEVSGSSSWHSNSHFYRSIPEIAPTSDDTFGAPPIRPPKSVYRYTSRKQLSIEYESTSTPSSPKASQMNYTEFPIESLSTDEAAHLTQIPAIQPSQGTYPTYMGSDVRF
ncbi:hypothetical protein O181_026325 [Austropuccinia psidii MF-1]|uniref:Uncharacterized protein n=1 Tax=Austropuccinia psidii MF-1 TaxID=1389203 RepID=A0A9Q3H226_9BASI|nr:hypothetical protein [Austropuccinia psidii MF-1]